MKLPAKGGTVASIRALALADLALALLGAYVLLDELGTRGFADTIAEVGPSTTWVAVTGLWIAPVLTVAWLGAGLFRLDRVAWVGQIAAGLVVPVVCVLFAVVGLAEGSWGPILGGLAAFFALSLVLLARRAARWSFGIGPDAVLAEIHTRGEISVAELAKRFSVRPEVVETLLAQTIARGVFLGGWDRSKGTVYSVATLLSREALRRCPRCGGAVESVAHVARCPYCATEFGELRGLEHPIPSPIGIELLTALDRVFAYVATFLAITWISTFLEARIRPVGEGATLWWIFGGLPVTLALFAIAVGRRLQAGRRSGWIGQQIAFPLAIPYLRRRRVRALFASGLARVQELLAKEGAVPFDALARALGVPPRHVEEIAVHLTATRTLDTVIDWQTDRLVARGSLDVDGRERCRSCGAPLRLGGSCAFCGTNQTRPRSPLPPPVLPTDGWRLARFVTWGAAIWLPFVAMAVRPVAPSTPTAEATERPLVTETPSDVALVPVGDDYDPTRQEIGWVGGGVSALAFDPSGRLFSGEQNGLFVWDRGRRTRRTPAEASLGGVRWIAFDAANDRFYFRPYHAAIVRGGLRDLRIASRLDSRRLEREIATDDGSLYAAPISVTTLDASGRLLLLSGGRALHVHDLTTGERLLEIPEEEIARGGPVVSAGSTADGPFELADATIDRSGSFVAYFAREATDAPGGLFATRRERLQVWDVATRAPRRRWILELSSTDAALLVNDRGRLHFAPDPRFLVTLSASELRYWDLEQSRATRVTDVRVAGPIAFSGDGRLLAVAHHPSPQSASVGVLVFEIDAGTLRSLGNVVTHDAEVSALAFDPTAEVLASGDVKGQVRFTTLRPFRHLPE
jgi:hypothetical protein